MEVALLRAECCDKFYPQCAFDYNKNNDMRMCIHCYVGLNLHGENKSIVKEYISMFSPDHESDKCEFKELFGKCLLCEHNAVIHNNFRIIKQQPIDDNIDKGPKIKKHINFTMDIQ